MRICLLEGDMSGRGGTERMSVVLANELCKDNEVWIVSLRFSEGKIHFQLDDKVKLCILSPAKGKVGSVKQIKEIHALIKKHRINTVINVDVGMGFYGIIAAKGTMAKVITWEHSNYFNNWNSKWFKHIRKFAAKFSDAMVVLTERDKENYEKYLPSKKPVYVIPNPVEKKEYFYNVDSKVILSAGQLFPVKGYDKAIKIAEKILPRYPGWKWVICGDGPERENLQKQINDARLTEQMKLVGNVQDMNKQYQQAAMYVMTSEMEGLPMVLLEAKSWGLPIVSFDIMTGPSDIVNNGINGYLVDEFNIDIITQKIETLMNDVELRCEFSQNAKYGIEKFELENIIEKWKEQIFKDVF